MPTLPNFPDDLADQHHHWHSASAHPGAGTGRTYPMGTPGGGLEFLTFHRNFMAQVMAWYNSTTFTTAPFNDPAQKAELMAPWTTVPDDLRDTSLGWNSTWAADSDRLDTLLPDFATDDELGTFIETGIHNNFLHGAAADYYNEPLLNGFHSPESSYFYKIHGLVDYWWSQWQYRHKRFIKEIVLEKSLRVELVKDVRPELKRRVEEVKRFGREVFDPFEEIEDPVEPVFAGALASSLSERIARIEAEVFTSSSATFIRNAERPSVKPPLVHTHGNGHGRD